MGWGTLHCCYRPFFLFFFIREFQKNKQNIKAHFPSNCYNGKCVKTSKLVKNHSDTLELVKRSSIVFGKYNINWKIKRIPPTSPYSSHTSALIPEYHQRFNGHDDRNLVRLVTRVYINHYHCGIPESKNNKLFIHHTGFSTVHHPALQTWALSFKNQEVALQRLFRAWADEGRIILLCSQKSKGQIPNTRSNTHSIH